jgi:signal peptidase I
MVAENLSTNAVFTTTTRGAAGQSLLLYHYPLRPLRSGWMTMPHLKDFLRIFFSCALLDAFWAFLAPQQIGGRCIYVIVSGNSMEPFMHTGDLAILRQSDDYQPGQVVVYRHPKLGSVIHRIIAERRGRYILQGDNNAWIDSFLPSNQDIEGALWLHLAGAGKVLRGFRTPLGAVLLAGVIGVFLFWPDQPERANPDR